MTSILRKTSEIVPSITAFKKQNEQNNPKTNQEVKTYTVKILSCKRKKLKSLEDGTTFHVYGLVETTLTMATFPKAIYPINEDPTKRAVVLFSEIEKGNNRLHPRNVRDSG